MRILLRVLAALALGSLAFAAHPARPNFASFGTDQIIVRLKPDSEFRGRGRGAQLAAELRTASGENVVYRRTTAEGHKVMRLPARRPLAAVEAIARALSRHPAVLEALPDRIVFPAATPNDPDFASQWSLTSADGINAVGAWDVATGNSQQIVALVDTGLLPHADIDAARVLPGYDFVSDLDKPRANDSDGRDADPTDPGDWVTAEEAAGTLAGCPVVDSSWHGTAVAGIIAAAANNAQGVAGINWATRLLPVRALGKCGGYVSDVADAILWSAGIPVSGVPDNTNPADLINLSLSIPTAGACDSVLQSAITFAVGQNIPVVVAAGNDLGAAASYSPANCAGVIAVGAVQRSGALATYANTGAPIAVAAPGGEAGDSTVGVLATSDTGTTTALNDSAYRSYYGTSIAAAHVTGVVSLMQFVNPTLGPADIKEIIRNTSRAFPAVSPACTTALCGDGIVNAQAAVQAAASFGTATPKISAGNLTTAGVRSDGTWWSWGNNAGGQFGVSPSTPASSPYPFKAPTLTGIILGTSARFHALGIRADNVLLSWGENGSAQLGRTTATPWDPGTVTGLTGVTQVSGGESHTLAQKSDGTLWGWGANASGQLGIGSNVAQPTPVQVVSMSGAVRVLAGQFHSVALKSDGTVWTWGINSSNQTGSGQTSFSNCGSTTTYSCAPVQVCAPAPTGCSGVLSNVVAIATSADATHSLALLGDGTVVAWGSNANGQLGNDSTSASVIPVTVCATSGCPTALANVVGIATGGSHSLALLANGTVVAWGRNVNGQIGDGTITSAANPRKLPVAALGVGNAVALAGGAHHSTALLADGRLMAWGLNNIGQLGDGSTTQRPTPITVQASLGSAFSLDLGATEFLPQAGAPVGGLRESNTITVATGAGGTITVSGDGNPEYRIENGSYTNAEGTVAAGQRVTARMFASSNCEATSTATVTINGAAHDFSVTTVACDGVPEAFAFATQAGVPVSSLRTSNTITVAGINTGVAISVSAGGAYSIGCAGPFVSTEGTINNGQQVCVQQASAATQDTSSAVALTIGGVSATFQVLTAPDENFAGTQMVRAGTAFSLGLRSDGTVYAWGGNSSGQLGNNSTSGSLNPVQSAVSGVTRIGAGSGHALALRSDGTVWSWGANTFGQLGNGGTMNRTTAVQVSGLSGVSRIAGGFFHSAAVKALDGSVWTWGYNGEGQLGDGTTMDRSTPVQVPGLSGIRRIVAGNDHTLALTGAAQCPTGGTVWAWGDNFYGQLGDGTTTDRLSPVAVPGLTDVVEIAAGGHADHSLALKCDGTVWAWGRNNHGQVGDGSTTNRLSPVQVLSGATQVAVGEFHSLALMTDATVRAWGFNNNGRLGDNTQIERLTPVQVQNLPFATMVAAGGGHSLAARPDGTVVAWGFNFYGQLGDGTATQRLVPTVVQGGGLNLDSNAAFFTPQAGVAFSEVRTSNTIRITGINDGSLVTVTGGEYRINNGDWTTSDGTMNDRDQVTVRQTSAATCNVTTVTNVFVGGAPRGGGFSVTTIPCDTTPDAFSFDPLLNQPLNVTAQSAAITVSGINANAAVGVSGAASSEYSLGCSGSWTNVAGEVANGDTVCVRHQTSGDVSTQTMTTLTIGGVSATFSSTTAAPQALTVSLSGDGNGTVASTSPNGSINCPSACAADFNPGAVVTLVATPTGGAIFQGWSGACAGAGPCQVTMSAAQFVTATFIPGPQVQSVKSRKAHGGGVGDLDIVVDHTAGITAGITAEPRAAVANAHKLIFTFDMAITDAGAATSVDAANQPVGSASSVAAGSTIEVTLTSIPNNQRVRVVLTGINGGSLASASLAFVLGDVDGTRSVTASDILRAKGKSGETTNGTNFTHDTDLSGTVSGTDVSAVQGNSGSET